jgi:hypothetical protein
LLGLSCNTSTKSNKQNKDKAGNVNEGAANSEAQGEDNTFKFHLNPTPGSQYYYTISNESNLELEVNDKKMYNQSKSNVGVIYDVKKDSAGNFLLNIRYDKIHLYTKTGDNESDMDADNSKATFNPVEKMLGILKTANIVATINPTGKIVSISGYKELGEQMMAGLNTADITTKNMAQNEWDKVVGEGLVKKNINELFNIFPDSAIKIGDTWKMHSQEKGQIALNVSSDYKLKDINDGVAEVESKGEMTSDKGEVNMMGTSVKGDLQGKQDGEYEIDTKTGMLPTPII